MYATKAQRCIRSASLELPLRTRNGLSIRQEARYASGGKPTLPDWSSQASTPVRWTSPRPGVGYFVALEAKNADENSSHLFDSSSERGSPIHHHPAQEMPAEPSVREGPRKRRRDRHDKYMAWLTERMAEDKSLETKTDLERKEIYWKEVECHILPDEFMPVRLRRHKEQEKGLPGPRMFVVRRTSQGTFKPQFDENSLPPHPDLTARPDFVETSEKTLVSPRMGFRPLRETVKDVEASGAEPQYARITVERASQGTLQPINETQSLPPHLNSVARPDVLDTSWDNLSPRERALQLQLARKEAERLRVKGKQVAFEHQYKHRCSWCGSPAHTRATCGLLQADIEDGLCHLKDGKVFVGRPWEGGPPIFRIKGLGEGTPLRNRLPRNPRPHVPKVQFVGATGRPGQERPAAIRKVATEVTDPFSAPPESGLPQETQQPQTAWPTPKPAREASPVRYFSPLPAEKPEEIDAARLLPPKIKPEYQIGENHEVLPIHKVPIDPGVPRDKLVFVRDSVARRIDKRENPAVRDEFDEDQAEDYPEKYEPTIKAPVQPEQIYHTDLPDSQIYDGTITSLKPSTLLSRAIEPSVPFLIRHPGSPDLASLASSSGMPAISQWFNPPPSTSLTALQREEYIPFTSFLTSSSRAQVVMPYEFLTPTIPFVNDGNHDLLSSFIFPDHPSLARFTPPPGTLSSLLEQCLDYLSMRPHLDNDIWYEAIANDTRRRLAFLEVKDGKPLTDIQWQTLRKWGALFQRFNAFHAPLELLIKAASPFEESGSSTPSLSGLYIAQAQLNDLPMDMQQHLPLPKVLAELYADNAEKSRPAADIYGANLWMGTPPTFTPLHKDPNPNFFIQLRGQKVIKLLSPTKGQEIYSHVQRQLAEEMGVEGAVNGGAIRGEEMMQGLERAELEKAVWTEGPNGLNENKGPAFQTEKGGGTVVLGPGDAVFIPKGWWHSVKSGGEGLNASVNWWFR